MRQGKLPPLFVVPVGILAGVVATAILIALMGSSMRTLPASGTTIEEPPDWPAIPTYANARVATPVATQGGDADLVIGEGSPEARYAFTTADEPEAVILFYRLWLNERGWQELGNEQALPPGGLEFSWTTHQSQRSSPMYTCTIVIKSLGNKMNQVQVVMGLIRGI